MLRLKKTTKKIQEAATRGSVSVACNIAKYNTPSSKSEFVKQCTVDADEAVCPENKALYENTAKV
jgi:hypothetical protein